MFKTLVHFGLIFFLFSCNESPSNVNDKEEFEVRGYLSFIYQFAFDSQSSTFHPISEISLNSKIIDSRWDGYYNFNEVNNGTYTLKAAHPDFEEFSHTVEVDNQDAGVEIFLQPINRSILSFSMGDEWVYSYEEIDKAPLNSQYALIEKKGKVTVKVVGLLNSGNTNYYELKEKVDYVIVAYKGFAPDSEIDTTYTQSEATFFANNTSDNILHFNNIQAADKFKDIFNFSGIYDINVEIPAYFFQDDEFSISRRDTRLVIKQDTGISYFHRYLSDHTYVLNLISFNEGG